MATPAALLSALYVYPVKSCRGLTLSASQFDRCGLLGDRRWMVVTPAGDFITQRELPRLACIVPRLQADGTLALEFEGLPDILVPAPSPGVVPVTVWRDRVLAADGGRAVAEWLEAALGRPARLVQIAPAQQRPLQRDPGAPAGVSAAFADAYPFLLTSEASLEALNSRLPRALPMDRFRPNLVVAGSSAFAEDGWRELRIGGHRFAVASPCQRCAITTTDQRRGVRDGKEPLRTLATFRRTGSDSGVYFGQNLVQLQGAGRLRVGDAVEIIQ